MGKHITIIGKHFTTPSRHLPC